MRPKKGLIFRILKEIFKEWQRIINKPKALIPRQKPTTTQQSSLAVVFGAWNTFFKSLAHVYQGVAPLNLFVFQL